MPRREWLEAGTFFDFGAALDDDLVSSQRKTNGQPPPDDPPVTPAEAAFELIGPGSAAGASARAFAEPATTAAPQADSLEPAPDSDEGGEPPEAAEAPAADPGSTQPIPASEAKAAAARSARADTAPQVQLVGVRESYAQRRLWDAVDVETGTTYVVEERRLAPGEEVSPVEPIDGFSDRFVYNPLARRVHDGRVITLFEAPRGESLESWRRRQGRDGATASAIMEVMRAVGRALQEIHEGRRLHLHLNPRTIWVDLESSTVGFTGVDQLERMPVERTRFRATVGFSAPELFGRSTQDIGPAADIYSLGAVTYYLIAGVVPPVAPETAFAPALAPRDFRPAFPVGWAEPVLRATDPVPSRRFASVQAYLDALELGFAHMCERSSRTAAVQLLPAAERHIGFAKALRCPVNQDHTFLAHDRARGWLLMAVADGVSTATFGSGDLASGFLVARAEEVWNAMQANELTLSPEEAVQRILIAANRDIVDYVNERHGPLDAAPSEVMGSTALVAFVDHGTMTLGALGDSRCYVIRKDLMECVTRDHNLFTLSLIEGLGIEEVLMMPHGDALARCLGTFDVDRDGYLLAVDPPIDMYRFKLLPGDHILLSTDGLFDYAGSTYEESEANIRRRVLSESHPGIACLELLVLANRGGGGDNIGVALIKVLNDEGRPD